MVRSFYRQTLSYKEEENEQTVRSKFRGNHVSNPTPRIVETHGGMLNAIGLQNPGIDTLIARDLPYLYEHGAHIIVNVCGRSKEDYVEVVERLADEDVDMLEINISCPNVKAGGIAFGQKPEMAE